MKEAVVHHADDAAGSSRQDPLALSTRLIHQCRLLLAELDVFQAALASRYRKRQQQQHLVEMRQLRSNVSSELKTLERLGADSTALLAKQKAHRKAHGDDDLDEDGDDANLEMEKRRILHTLRSSNLPFYFTVWTIAKEHCHGVVAFFKRFYWDRDRGSVFVREKEADANGRPMKRKPTNHDKKKSAFVDIVHEGGEEWLKISTITESRLLFEMAEKGWDLDNDEDDDDPYGLQRRTVLRNNDSEEDDDDDDDQIELIKMATDMIKATQTNRVKYKTPRVRIIAPKLVEGRIPEIDHVLNTIRRHGVSVECGTKIPDIVDGDRDPSSVSEDDLPLSTLLPNPFEKFTTVINVDCTLLLAVVSDLSHLRQIPPSPSHHRAILRQIEVEEEIPLLTAELWPAMSGHQLVCTKEAVNRMKEIVNTIGTETEKKRTAIFLGEGEMQKLGREKLLQQFQQLSDHAVPNNWQIPIEIVEAGREINDAWQQNRFPPVAHKVTEILSDINRSVFLYGWARNIVTITSNRTVVKQIENVIEANRGDDNDLEGPMVWVCDTARSLIGKDKNRKP